MLLRNLFFFFASITVQGNVRSAHSNPPAPAALIRVWRVCLLNRAARVGRVTCRFVMISSRVERSKKRGEGPSRSKVALARPLRTVGAY